LLYRGDQYRRAIEGYYALRKDYPQNIDDLLRTRGRRQSNDICARSSRPDQRRGFVAVRNTVTRRIIGVNSRSDKEPLEKKGFPIYIRCRVSHPQLGFPVNYNNFLDKMKYSEWLLYQPRCLYRLR